MARLYEIASELDAEDITFAAAASSFYQQADDASCGVATAMLAARLLIN